MSLNSVAKAFRSSIRPPSKTSFALPSTTSRCPGLFFSRGAGWDVESSTIQEDSLKGSRRVEWIVGAAVEGHGDGRWVYCCSTDRVLAIHCRCFSRLKNIVYDARVNLRVRMVYGLRYGLCTEKRPRLTKTIQSLDGDSVFFFWTLPKVGHRYNQHHPIHARLHAFIYMVVLGGIHSMRTVAAMSRYLSCFLPNCQISMFGVSLF